MSLSDVETRDVKKELDDIDNKFYDAIEAKSKNLDEYKLAA